MSDYEILSVRDLDDFIKAYKALDLVSYTKLNFVSSCDNSL